MSPGPDTPPGAPRRVALVTGGSRGVGAATARRLAVAGYDVALTYRDKARRAEGVGAEGRGLGARALCLQCDITLDADRRRLVEAVGAWSAGLDLLVLNASGGLEREMLRRDPGYPMLVNRDAQVEMVRGCLDLLAPGADVHLVTSHWAHLYGSVEQLPAYEDVGRSKHAGEQALRAMQPVLSPRGVRLLVITGDLIEGTITARLLERKAHGTTANRRDAVGRLPNVDDMAEAIAGAAADRDLPWGATVVVGGALERLAAPA